jgi:nucleoside-diphosphate-sugar epimerase
VVGLDCDLFAGCDFGRIRSRIPDFEIDLRDIEFTDLLSFDAVVHLADLPQPSASRVDPARIDEINVAMTIRLAECCKQAKVSRFLFASTCAVYGRGRGEVVNEQSPVAPVTPRAASKLRCERGLARLADGAFSPVYLRNPTIYGVSPRLRLDLVVNEFVAAATTTGQIRLRTAGRAWRPLLHVEDVARTYLAVLTAPDEAVHNQALDVASPSDNHRIVDVADAASEVAPNCTWRATSETFDEQSYRVKGTKLRQTFPKLAFRWNLLQGIRQLRTAMIGAGLTPGDWRSDQYRRQAKLNTLIERGELTEGLRRSEPVLPMQDRVAEQHRQKAKLRTGRPLPPGDVWAAVGA